tara:strand:+ start:534 stop:938 length:405 start_codon:yes stop_codon:yes gene_type:complete
VHCPNLFGLHVPDLDDFPLPQVHFDERAQQKDRYLLTLLWTSVLIMVLVGFLLGCISACITLLEVQIFTSKKTGVAEAMWPCAPDCALDEAPHASAAFVVFLAANGGLLAVAVAMTWCTIVRSPNHESKPYSQK